MTLRRTIQRRDKRKRAKQRHIEAARRWAQMSPASRALIQECNALAFDALTANLQMVQHINSDYEFAKGDQWPTKTIDVRLPERYRK